MGLINRYLLVVVTVIITMMASVIAIGSPKSPMGLPWGKPITHPSGRLVLPDYQYSFGDPGWGQIRYSGKKDINGISSELIVYYTSGRLSSALLILGPEGLDENNCISKYKEMVEFLNKKYGNFKFQSHIVDPDIDDLIFSKRCHAVKVGMESMSTRWENKRFRVESFLFGDEGMLFIEIEYVMLELERKEKEAEAKKVIRRL